LPTFLLKIIRIVNEPVKKGGVLRENSGDVTSVFSFDEFRIFTTISQYLLLLNHIIFFRAEMNKITKYITGIFGIIIATYVGWMVINATFPVDEWFEKNPSWRPIIILVVIFCIIGLLSTIIKSKGK